MLDTRLTDDVTLRCDALFDRVQATPIGRNAHALTVSLAECEALERSLKTPSTIYKLRTARHWLRLAYGPSLHAYPPERLRMIVLDALSEFRSAIRSGL